MPPSFTVMEAWRLEERQIQWCPQHAYCLLNQPWGAVLISGVDDLKILNGKVIPSIDFFLLWWNSHPQRCEGFIRLILWTSSLGRCHLHTHLPPAESGSCPQWECLGCAGERFAQWSKTPIINTRSWWIINSTICGNESGGSAEAHICNNHHVYMHILMKLLAENQTNGLAE